MDWLNYLARSRRERATPRDLLAATDRLFLSAVSVLGGPVVAKQLETLGLGFLFPDQVLLGLWRPFGNAAVEPLGESNGTELWADPDSQHPLPRDRKPQKGWIQ